ncbi:MAG: hypothetical protein WKH64_02580 [Chloroflexia bacterium]
MTDDETRTDETVRVKMAVLTDLEELRRACEGTEWGGSSASDIGEIRNRIKSVGPVVPEIEPADVAVIVPTDPDEYQRVVQAKQNTLADLEVWQRAAELRDAGQDVLRILQQVRVDIMSVGPFVPTDPEDG